MPVRKYQSADTARGDADLLPPLETLASRESVALRQYLNFLLSVQPAIFAPLAIELRAHLADILGVADESLPVEKVTTRQTLWELILCRFLYERPWTKGLEFHSPKATFLLQGDTGFRQVNVRVRAEVALAARASVELQGTNVSAWVWTALHWFATKVVPPSVVRAELGHGLSASDMKKVAMAERSFLADQEIDEGEVIALARDEMLKTTEDRFATVPGHQKNFSASGLAFDGDASSLPTTSVDSFRNALVGALRAHDDRVGSPVSEDQDMLVSVELALSHLSSVMSLLQSQAGSEPVVGLSVRLSESQARALVETIENNVTRKKRNSF